MKLSEAIKPISYLKANTAEVVRKVCEEHQPYIITQNGEAKVVVQDIREYEELQNTLTMLKLLAFGEKDLEDGRAKPLREAFKEVRTKVKKIKRQWSMK